MSVDQRTEARVDWQKWDAKLRSMWAAGDTASAIAKTIPGATRNSVAKRAERIPLSPRTSPIIGDVAAAAAKGAQTRAAQKAALGSSIASALGRAHRKPMEAPPRVDYKAPNPPPPTKCQWPLTDKRPWLFCEAVVERGSYCGKHGTLAYAAPSEWAKRQYGA